MSRNMGYSAFIWAGIRRKSGRNIAAIFCFAFIAANFFCAQYLIAGAVGNVDVGLSRMGADLLVVPVQYSAYYLKVGPENTAAIVRPEASTVRMKPGTLEVVRSTKGVARFSPQLYVSTLRLPLLSSKPVDIFGFDPVTDFTIQPWLKRPLGRQLGPGEVIIGSGLNGEVSSEIAVNGHSYRIAGRLEPTGTALDQTLFLPLDDAYDLASYEGFLLPTPVPISRGELSAILVELDPEADPGTVAARIMQPSAAITVIARHFTLNPVSQEVRDLPGFLNITSMVVVVAAFPLIALIASMVANERRREIGLLKAMGARRNTIIFLVMTESLILSATGGIVGISGSLLALALLNGTGALDNLLQISFVMPSPVETGIMAGIVLVVVISLGTISSFYPAYQCSKMNAYDAMRADE
jgi:putative ABC transport system permease protein